MKLTFYKRINPDNVLWAKGISLGEYNDYITFGFFNPKSARFVIDRQYEDCNFLSFDWNGVQYSGWCDITVNAEGLWVYTITRLDPLWICYEAGCFEYNNLIAYSKMGTNSTYQDPRIPQKITPITRREDFNFFSYSAADWMFVLVVANGEGAVAGTDTGTPAGTIFKNPQYNIYALNWRGFNDFLRRSKNNMKISFDGETIDVDKGEEYTAFMNSIVSAYAVPSVFITPLISKGMFVEVNEVRLYGMCSYWMSDRILTSANVSLAANDSKCYKSNLSTTSSSISDIKRTVSFINNPFSFSNSSRYSSLTGSVYVPLIGELKFTAKELEGIKSITSIGARVGLGLCDGRFRATLVVNNKEFPNILIEVNNPMRITVPTELSATTTEQFREQLGNIVSIVGSAVVSGASIATGGFSVPLIAGAGIMGMNSGFKLAESSTTANAISSVSTGDNIDLIQGKQAWVLLQCYEQPNLYTKFGYPDFTMRVLSTLKSTEQEGWVSFVQTQNCQLKQNGVPLDIIQSCQIMFDSGVYI